MASRTDRFYFTPIIFISGGYFLLFLSQALYLEQISWFGISFILLISFYTVISIYNILSIRPRRLISSSVPCFIFGILFVYNGEIFDQVHYFTIFSRLHICPSCYDECIEFAAEIGYGAVFNICERHEMGSTLNVIIYDTREHLEGDPFTATTSGMIDEKTLDIKTQQALAVAKKFGDKLPIEIAHIY